MWGWYITGRIFILRSVIPEDILEIKESSQIQKKHTAPNASWCHTLQTYATVKLDRFPELCGVNINNNMWNIEKYVNHHLAYMYIYIYAPGNLNN